ncbi:MAG: hypothetical protein JXO49_04260 [Deltaproteobacteria bacterium]|nr:hypothetical protein [Candidatus Anaeroferrophillus wilburensis]MBN2888542.1 hypothetical protein [Deltaproteobacteria bacterium]
MSDMPSQMKKKSYVRRTYLVDRTFQVRFSLLFFGGVMVLGLLAGVATYVPARNMLVRHLYSPHISFAASGEILARLFIWLNVGFALPLIVFSLMLVTWYVRRTAGSLQRLRASLAVLAAGRIPPALFFRRRDPLNAVAADLNLMVVSFRDRQQIIIQHLQAARALLKIEDEREGLSQPLPVLEQVRREVQAALEVIPEREALL